MSQRQGMNGKEIGVNRGDAPEYAHGWTLDDAVQVTRRIMHDYRLFRFWCVGAVRFHSVCERKNEENRTACQ